MEINKELIKQLFDQAIINPRKRQNLDLRTSMEDNSQRMLNVLMPGSEVPIHRHSMSNENVLCLCGKLVEVLYEEETTEGFKKGIDAQDAVSCRCLKESARYMLDPTVGNFGCVVPAGVWHTVEVLEPCVIYEAKDGKYGEDGSETW